MASLNRIIAEMAADGNTSAFFLIESLLGEIKLKGLSSKQVSHIIIVEQAYKAKKAKEDELFNA